MLSHQYIILLSLVKKLSNESGEKYAQIKHCLQVKTVRNSSKQICGWIMKWEENRGWTRTDSLEEVLLWIIYLYFGQRHFLKLKMSYWWICSLQTRSFSLHKMLIAGLETCGLMVDNCNVFISCLDSHSDGTHSLQRNPLVN